MMENEDIIKKISEETKEFALEFADRNVENAITRLILLLYKYETEDLETDLIKCIALNPDYSPSRQERSKLMRWLWQNISCVYRNYDYSALLDRVKEINENHRVLAEAGEDVPFV